MTVWLNSPRTPKPAMIAVSARMSGTMDATKAPNVASRMMNVSPIVTNVVSRLLLIRFVMSSLVSVWLTVWTTNPWSFSSIVLISGRTGTRRRSTTT